MHRQTHPAAFRSYLLILAVCIVHLCTGQAGLSGKWQNDEFERSIKLQINTDGKGVFDGEPFTYTLQENQITFQLAGTKTIYTYAIQGNELILSGADLDGPISFLRADMSQEKAKPEIVAQDPKTDASPTAHPIQGVWTGNGESFEFKASGECIYLGQAMRYEITQDVITIVSPQRNIDFAYTLDGDQLILQSNGMNNTYSRSNAASASDTLRIRGN